MILDKREAVVDRDFLEAIATLLKEATFEKEGLAEIAKEIAEDCDRMSCVDGDEDEEE